LTASVLPAAMLPFATFVSFTGDDAPTPPSVTWNGLPASY